MDIGAFVDRVTPVEVKFDKEEDTAHFGVNSKRLTGPAVFRSQALSKFNPDEQPEKIPEFEPVLNLLLSDFIVEWDMTWHGEAFPPNAENVARLPFLIKLAMIQAINQELQPDSKPLTTSLDSSNTEVSEVESALIGTPTSFSPTNGAHHPGPSLESQTPLVATFG